MDYTAFISYRRSDGTKTANWLRSALQSFRPPRSLCERHGKPVRIFLDTAYERGADDFYVRTIRPALLASRHLIVLATPDAAARGGRIEDDWMAREIADFGVGPNAGNLIVVRAAGAFDGPLPGNLAETYPNAQIIDLRGATEWNLLNLGRKAFFDNEKLKIVAALLDIPLEDMPLLRREEERKRQARIGLLTGLAAAVVVMSVGVSVYSIRAQLFGQRSIDQGLSEAESALTRIARQRWDDNALLRSRDHAIGAMCEVASRLAVEAARARDAEARAICDLEYLLPYASDGALSDEQSAFASGEFERLGGVARELRASATPDDEAAAASKLAFAIAANRGAFLSLPPAEAFAAEQAVYLPAIRAGVERAAAAGGAEAAAGARNTARGWLALATHRYSERLREMPAREFDPGQEGLTALSGLAHAVLALPYASPPDPADTSSGADTAAVAAGAETPANDLAWTFAMLNLIGSVVVDESLELPDVATARRALATASEALDALPPEHAGPRGLRTRLQGWKIALTEAGTAKWEADAFERYDRLAEIMDEAHARTADFAATKGDGELDASGEFDEFARRLGEELHLLLDAVQANARKLAEKGDPVAAGELLANCHRRREALYRLTHEGSEWPRVFQLSTEVEMIALQAATGDPDGAEARRLAQWRKEQERPLDRSDLRAVEAQRYDAAFDALVSEHYLHLDGMRDGATALQEKGEHRAAIALLGKLLRNDRDWDIAKAAPSDFDRVYAGEVSLQLAESQEEAGDFGAAHRTRLRALRELLPVIGGHELVGDNLARAEAVWKRALEWGNASGVPIAELEPIVTLEAF